MDKDTNHPEKLTNQPSISVSPWLPQQPARVGSSYDVVLIQPGHSDERIYGDNETIRDYTILSVFTILCCCLPIGLFALFYARTSVGMLAAGRRREALERSIISRNINISAMIIGPIVYAFSVALNIYVFSKLPYPYRTG